MDSVIGKSFGFKERLREPEKAKVGIFCFYHRMNSSKYRLTGHVARCDAPARRALSIHRMKTHIGELP
jgi:hypothetical protein